MTTEAADGSSLGPPDRSEDRLARAFGGLGIGPVEGVARLVESLSKLIGGPVRADRFDCRWGPTGLRRPGAIAQLSWPRLGSRVGLGIDPPLAHAIVDQLLGCSRSEAEAKLQVSPVEWGILSFLIAQGLDRLESGPAGPLGPWDLTIDRVGPDPFDAAGLGSLVTWRWRVDIDGRPGSARLWVPAALILAWLDAHPSGLVAPEDPDLACIVPTGADWRAEVGTIRFAPGTLRKRLQLGALILIEGSPLSGTAADPVGLLELVRVADAVRIAITTRVEAGSNVRRLVVESPEVRRTHPDAGTSSPATDAPVLEGREITLTAELGHVDLSADRLAALRAGEVIELARHATEPVALTSSGRVVARGKFVQVDTELGVRILSVFC